MILAIAILSVGIILLGFVIKLMYGKIKKLADELERKNYAIERAAQNLKVLTDYQRLIQKIRTNHYGFIERIGKVKEDDSEEIDNILRDIVTINNLSVSNRKNNTD